MPDDTSPESTSRRDFIAEGARWAAVTSAGHATSVDHGVSGRVASGARPRRVPATYAVDTGTKWMGPRRPPVRACMRAGYTGK